MRHTFVALAEVQMALIFQQFALRNSGSLASLVTAIASGSRSC
jgi:hypothetical protein